MPSNPANTTVISLAPSTRTWRTYTVNSSAFQPAQIDPVSGTTVLNSGETLAAALKAFGARTDLGIAADGSVDPKGSSFERWAVGTFFRRSDGAWIVAVGDVVSLATRTMIGEFPTFAAALAAAVAAAS